LRIVNVTLLLGVFLTVTIKSWGADRIYVSHSAISGSQAILFVTRDAGFFKKYDIEPQVILVAGAPPNIAALVSGEIDFTVFAGPAAIASNLEGADTVVLMTYINTMEHTFITRPSVRKPADLKGKKFGIARPGATDDYGARVAFRKWGLDPEKDITWLSVGTQPSRFGRPNRPGGWHAPATAVHRARAPGGVDRTGLAGRLGDRLPRNLTCDDPPDDSTEGEHGAPLR